MHKKFWASSKNSSKKTVARFDREIDARRAVDAHQHENLAAIIRSAEQRHAFYAEQLKSDQSVAEQGFLTRRTDNSAGKAGEPGILPQAEMDALANL
jgi:hypothetical protein